MKKGNYRAVALTLALLLALGGCKSPGPAKEGPGMRIDFENGQAIRNGTEQRLYQVERGQTGELLIQVHTGSGSLSISVFPTENPNHFYYRGREIPTSEFSVILPDAGEYTVWIEAEDFEGSYEFSWSTR